MTLGLASFGQRASIVFAIAAGLIALWRLPSSRRRVARALAVIVALLVVWQLVDPLLPLPGNLRPQLATLSSERARLAMWEVGLRSAVERPALGWGPGSTRSAHIAEATASELEVSGRGVGDAHNLFVTALVETGVIGLVLLAVLVAMLLARAWPRSRSAERAPAFAAAILLGVTSMIEPVNLVVTPLLFLFLAVAGPVSGDVVAARWPPVGRRVGRAIVALALGVSLLVSVQMLAAASLERWGRVYGEPWALQAALRVQPWRLTSTERLALIWALDGRAGDEAAGERARDLMAGAVDEHPWDPDVRPWAADVETLLDDRAAARAWIEEHLERFPGDERAVREAGSTGAGGLENPLAGA
jgi:O-Antigen ligase